MAVNRYDRDEREALLGSGAKGCFYESANWRFTAGWLWLLLAVTLWTAFVYGPMLYRGYDLVDWDRTLRVGTLRVLPLLLVVGPMVMVVAAGGLDLSVGSVFSLTSVVVALAISKGWSTSAAIWTGIGCAAGVGFINALAVGVFRVHGALVTLGMAVVARSVAVMVSGGGKVIPVEAVYIDKMPETRLFWMLAGGAVFLSIIMTQLTRFGRRPSPEKEELESAFGRAVHVGLPYILSGAAAGAAGLFLLTRVEVGSPMVGVNMEVHVLLAVILGGTFVGGRFGCVLGAVVGSGLFILTHMQMELLDYSAQLQAVIFAGGLIAAAALNRFYWWIVAGMYDRRKVRAVAAMESDVESGAPIRRWERT